MAWESGGGRGKWGGGAWLIEPLRHKEIRIQAGRGMCVMRFKNIPTLYG